MVGLLPNIISCWLLDVMSQDAICSVDANPLKFEIG